MTITETYWQIRKALSPNVDPKTASPSELFRSHALTSDQKNIAAALLTIAEVIRAQKDTS